MSRDLLRQQAMIYRVDSTSLLMFMFFTILPHIVYFSSLNFLFKIRIIITKKFALDLPNYKGGFISIGISRKIFEKTNQHL